MYVHAADAARARSEVTKPESGWGPIKIGPLLGFLWYSGRRGGLRVPPMTELVTFDDGATLDLPGSPRVIPMPGHTPGSVAIHVPSVDAVFVGDAMTTRSVLTGAVGPQPAPFTLDPAGALGFARPARGRRRALGPAGHGDAWDGGVEEAVRRIRVAAAERDQAKAAAKASATG